MRGRFLPCRSRTSFTKIFRSGPLGCRESCIFDALFMLPMLRKRLMGETREELVFGCYDRCTMQGRDHPLMGGGGDNDVRLMRLQLDRFRIRSLPSAQRMLTKCLRDFVTFRALLAAKNSSCNFYWVTVLDDQHTTMKENFQHTGTSCWNTRRFRVDENDG